MSKMERERGDSTSTEHRAQSTEHRALTVLELTKLHLLEGLGVGGLEAEGVLMWRWAEEGGKDGESEAAGAQTKASGEGRGGREGRGEPTYKVKIAGRLAVLNLVELAKGLNGEDGKEDLRDGQGAVGEDSGGGGEGLVAVDRLGEDGVVVVLDNLAQGGEHRDTAVLELGLAVPGDLLRGGALAEAEGIKLGELNVRANNALGVVVKRHLHRGARRHAASRAKGGHGHEQGKGDDGAEHLFVCRYGERRVRGKWGKMQGQEA